ncbi:MAG: hypothetical protein K5930_03740 [Treponemataceae bacterium]|nr:hypothetical protein [Treponemataceae bacterium]
MHRSENFICISYPKIDFLIPGEYVISAVSISDLDSSMLHDETSGIFDFDEIAAIFAQLPREANVKTMIMLKGEDDMPLSVVTAQECKVCSISLNDFSLFPELYAERLKKNGLLACLFENKRIKYLIDIKKIMECVLSSSPVSL